MTRSTSTRIATVILVLTLPLAARAGELAEELNAAVRSNDIVQVQGLLERGVEVDSRDELGNTALMIAAAFGYDELAQILVQRGADVGLKGRIGHTALSYAVEEGHIEIARMLLENGADVYIANDYGNTVQKLASGRGHGEIAALVAQQQEMEEPVAVAAVGWTLLVALGVVALVAGSMVTLDTTARTFPYGYNPYLHS